VAFVIGAINQALTGEDASGRNDQLGSIAARPLLAPLARESVIRRAVQPRRGTRKAVTSKQMWRGAFSLGVRTTQHELKR
jgi:hypothetical protein